jgi:cytoskeleton protein RodZ
MTKITHLTPDQRGERGRRIDSREPADERGAPEATVGQALRSARLARGDDIATVSRALRIRRDHLEAIEDERLEALPGRAYAVGFVRSYAKYLGLDAAACVERFKSETAGRPDATPQIGPPPPDLGGGRMPSGWTAMAILVVGVVLYGGWHLARSADFFSSQPVAPVPARLATPGDPAQVSHPPPRSAVSAASTVALARIAGSGGVKVAAEGAPMTAAGAPGGASSLSADGQPAARDASPDGQSARLPGQVYGANNTDSRVILHVSTATHVLVQGPGGRVYINRILHPGDTYRVPDIVGLSLTAQDGGAVSVELDGQNLGAAGRAGQMADALSLDPQAIVDRAHGGNPG